MNRRTIRLFVLLIAFAVAGCASAPPQPPDFAQSPAFTKSAPAEAEALWRKAEQSQKEGKIQSAISAYERIAQKYSNNVIAAKALQRLGNIQRDQGNLDRALQYYDYLLYMYPKWPGVNSAQTDRLKALMAMGKRKQVMKEAALLWQTASGEPEVQVELSMLMAEAHRSERDIAEAFEWLASGFAVATTPEEKQRLTRATSDLLKEMREADIKKISKKNTSDFMRVFLEFRMDQILLEKGRDEGAKEHMKALLKQNPTHPIAPEIHAALRGAGVQTALAASGKPVNPNRVGCLIPMSGTYEKYGKMVLRGLGMAIDEWGKTHPGAPVNLVVRDSQVEAQAAIKSFEELVNDEGVLAVVGPLGAQSAKVLAPVADKWGVPLLTLTQQDEETAGSSFVLHVFIDNRELVRSMVRYCRDKLGYTRFAALYPDDRYGQRLSKIFAEVLKEEGGSLLASVPYKEKTTDFKDALQKVMNVSKQNVPPSGVDIAPFEALFVPDQVQTVSLLAPQLPYYNIVGVTLLGTNLWGEAPLVQAGGAYVEQALFATPYFPESDVPRAKAFAERYQSVYSAPPSYLEAQAYDAMMLFLESRSMLRGRPTERFSLLQNLLQIRNYEGVAGTYSFNADGTLNRDYLILQVQNGQLTQVGQ